jgi:hypothetical protein
MQLVVELHSVQSTQAACKVRPTQQTRFIVQLQALQVQAQQWTAILAVLLSNWLAARHCLLRVAQLCACAFCRPRSAQLRQFKDNCSRFVHFFDSTSTLVGHGWGSLLLEAHRSAPGFKSPGAATTVS